MKNPSQHLGPIQLELSVTVEKEVEVNGIQMGVLKDGTRYLTGRGLARMCGVDQKQVVDITAGWSLVPLRPREKKIKDNLVSLGIDLDKIFIELKTSGSATYYAYSDVVCMAILEYYAFDGSAGSRETALRNYRLLARKSFREFIYTQVGYDPRNAIPEIWKQFHDRVSLVWERVPDGYFSIFKEVSDIIVTFIRGGAEVGPEFVPDISIGQHWGRHWRENQLDDKYGHRIKYEHDYPDSYPQSASNPQSPFCYPDAALGEFRKWVREVYLVEKLPNYMTTKVKDGLLPPSFAEMALQILGNREKPRALG